MLEFPCRCGSKFRLEDDQAGGLVQCPRCGLLNDVPTQQELKRLAADGTFKVEASAPRRDSKQTAADLAYIYQRGARDAQGKEIDLRLSDEEADAIGLGDPIPLVPLSRSKEHAPRYDPESGELIAPLEVKQERRDSAAAASIPMAKAVIGYASGQTVRKSGYLTIALQLLSPLNLAVMFAVFLMHALLLPLALVLFAGIAFLVVAVPVLAGAIFAHYGNTIEDIGPFERDELPRPLRDVGWYEDFWHPFCAVFGSLLLCYGTPIFVAMALVHLPILLASAIFYSLLILGTFLLPAVMLTMQTSGTSLNLRPDRLIGMIRACGKDYLILVLIWIATAVIYSLGWLGTTLAVIALTHISLMPWWLTSWAVTTAALAGGVFAMHYFCWCMGMLYRRHYDGFPWVFQRHISTRTPDQQAGRPSSRRPGGAQRPSPQRAREISRGDGGRTGRR